MENKKLEDMSILELKATLFDIDQEIKMKQNQYQQVGVELQKKVNELNKKDE